MNVRLLMFTTLAVVLLVSGSAAAQEPAAQPVIAPGGEAAALMSDDPARRMAAMEILRKDKVAARRKIIMALRARPLPAGWWRAVHRLNEFGRSYDIGYVVGYLRHARDQAQRRVVLGTLEALYERPESRKGFSSLLQDMEYQKSRNPVPLKGNGVEQYMLTDWSFDFLHRMGFSAAWIFKLEDFRGVPHRTETDLLRALRKKLGRKAWVRHREVLTRVVDQKAPGALLQGKVRLRLRNPATGPLLIHVALDLWFGRFNRPSKPVLVYLPAGRTRTIQVPVSAVGNTERKYIRMDARLTHFNGQVITTYKRAYAYYR